MIKTVSRSLRPLSLQAMRCNSSTPKNFHRPDSAGSDRAVEAADATATIMADMVDSQHVSPKQGNWTPNKSSWIAALTERNKQLKEGKILDSYLYIDPKTTKVGERTRADSFTYLSLPFKLDEWLCDSYINAFGRLRAGQLFQDLDALAGRIAYRHCAPAEPVNVTASVDRIYMVKKVDEITNFNFLLAGSVTWTGRSSMEITVKGYAFDEELPTEVSLESLPDDKVFLTANFTFVARNPVTHKSFAINRLIPTTEKEWLDHRRAESHNAKKKLAAKNHQLIQPTDEENRLAYDMWRSAKSLVAQQKTLPPGIAFMKDTTIQLTLFMQPQYRNRHSYMIFGGYLLRQSFELAYVALAGFLNAGPRFVSLDSTTFKAPVPVGSILLMQASIVYTEHIHSKDTANEPTDSPFNFVLPATNKLSLNPDAFLLEPGTLIQVKVDTSIKHLDTQEYKESGSFIYSFFVPKTSSTGKDQGFSLVIPQTYSEMMEYVNARRRAQDTANYVDSLPGSDL